MKFLSPDNNHEEVLGTDDFIFDLIYVSGKIIEALKVNGPFFAIAMRQNEGHFGFSFQSMSQDFQGLINSLPLCPVK